MKKNRLPLNKLAGLVCAGALLMPVAGYCGADKFIDSDDYKDKEFKKCNIADYSDLEEGDDIDWIWMAPDAKLSNYKMNLRKVENKSKREKNSITETLKSAVQKHIKDMKENKGAQTLNADVCIYETEDYSPGKAWIPFAGGHQMQAGIGIEVVLNDKSNKAVAKIRHFARQGIRVEDAAYEAADDLFEYIEEH